MKLEASATYETQGDCIIANIYLFDESANVFTPQHVHRGLAKLCSNNNVLHTVDFDRRMGNDDGSIKIIIQHPVLIKNLKFDISVHLQDKTTYNIIVPVVIVGDNMISGSDKLTPLAQQPAADPSVLDVRTKKRIAEGI